MSLNRTHWSALICLLLASPAAAQSTRAQEKEMTLVLVKALHDSSAVATIVREPGANGRTMIVLPEAGADAIALATALTSLERSVKNDGEEPENEIVITLHGLRSPSSLSADEHHRAEEYVLRLRKMKPRDMPEYGPARVLVVRRGSLEASS